MLEMVNLSFLTIESSKVDPAFKLYRLAMLRNSLSSSWQTIVKIRIYDQKFVLILRIFNASEYIVFQRDNKILEIELRQNGKIK